MAQPRKTAQTRTRARLRRERERTPAFAASLSIATIFAVALLSVIVMCSLPGTALSNLFQGLQADPPLRPGSVLYRQILSQVEYQDDLIFTPLSLFLGGLTLGRVISPRFSRFQLLRIAAAVSAGVLTACLLFRWALVLMGQNWHLRAGEVNTQIALTQTACTVGWILAYLLGTWLGVGWRDRLRHDGPGGPAKAGIPAA